MYILGIAGGIEPPYESNYNFEAGYSHDAAAVLLKDGVVVAAIEEERLDRIKHSNRAPMQSIAFCLKQAGIELAAVDRIAYNSSREHAEAALADIKAPPQLTPEMMFKGLIDRQLKSNIDMKCLRFIEHHQAHAVGAYAMSGFDQSLVVTFDGNGEGAAGRISIGEGGRQLRTLVSYSTKKQSLGIFYDTVIAYLGYRMFDEYKVMGLAPYGDPKVFKEVLQTTYHLLPNGQYEICFPAIPGLHRHIATRTKGEPFTQPHKDLAAALQNALEEIVFHVLSHHRKTTGLRKLCLAGGVAHNCTLNGKLLYSGMFDEMFVQPAAHDAGCALGAALSVYLDETPGARVAKQRHLFWGSNPGASAEVRSLLERWGDFVEYTEAADVFGETAKLLAEGSVIGWVQGRSEFGPRALGNRSILADPRPAENKSRINAMVKKREGYRPFAPSVLEEKVEEYFDVPPGVVFPFMIFVLKVKAAKQQLLQAITHVDGTARVQTVSRTDNEPYWKLIHAFGELTGVPMLLNTSFNNNVEPIVDTASDAVACFLTTGLNYLVVGTCVAKKRAVTWQQYLGMSLRLPLYTKLRRETKYVSESRRSTVCQVASDVGRTDTYDISDNAFRLLTREPQTPLLSASFEALGISDAAEQQRLVEELVELWARRWIDLQPPEKRT